MSHPRSLALGLIPLNSNPEDWLCAGPFCFAGQEESFPEWENRFHFAPEPLANPDILQKAARIAQSLCIAGIIGVSSELDPGYRFHSPSYWQILLAPFCMDLARQLVERTLRCEAMVRVWGTYNLNVRLLPENCSFQFADDHDFTLNGNLGEKFNHWIFSRILENMWPGNWQREYLGEYTDRAKRGEAKKKPLVRLKDLIRRYLLYLPFPRLKGMSIFQAALFSSALSHALKKKIQSVDLEKIYFKPDLLNSIKLPENYEMFFSRFLPESIRKLKLKRNWRKNNTKNYLRIVSPVAYEDAEYRRELAEWRESGNSLAWVQHGGNYGQVRTSCEAELIEYSQDYFFTWGWDKYENVPGNFIPMPYPQLANLKNAWNGKNERIIFTGTEMAAYGYRLDSHPTPLQFVEYRQWKAEFLKSLPEDLRAKIWYRPYFHLPGTLADASWLLPQFPEIKLCEGQLTPQILECRLLVLDHHGTTLLEAMAADIPVVLFWNRAYWLLTSECEKLVDMLEERGIWHSTPQSAAKKIMEIWPDTRKWWKSPEIMEAREIFCNKQARLPWGNLNKIWMGELKSL